ncbi:YncE family protein [Rhodococcus sp. WMMA185]|uniref:YncE family protein n=1 Tax=Rhodococcus sp. WMMA185 TaxID=679318 RepID=UPI0018DDE2B8|nr:YncE family protein [Rhodococcus sp. WMMA185]
MAVSSVLRRRNWVAGVLAATVGVTAACSSTTEETEQSPPASNASGVVQAPALAGEGQPISSMDRVYVADQTSNGVSVINPATNEVLGSIALGSQRLDGVLGPQYVSNIDVHGLGFSQDGQHLGVVSVTTNTVTIINTADNTIANQTYVGRAPHEGFFTPDGSEFWVADRALAQVDIVDVANGGVTGHIETGDGPSKVLFSPDGQTAYVNHIRSATIDVIDVASKQVSSVIDGLADPMSSDFGLSPDGAELWAPHKGVGKASIIDTNSGTVKAIIDTGPDVNHANFVTTDEGDLVYLTVGGTNEIRVYQRTSEGPPELIHTIMSTGVEPHGIWPSPDNTRVYAVNEHSDSVSVIDTATQSVIATLDTGQEGQALVYVANAVPDGDGTENLTQQGIGARVENADIPLDGPGYARVTVREVDGQDMFSIDGAGLMPSTTYTATADLDGQAVPILSFTTNDIGYEMQAAAFTEFFDNYDIGSVRITPQTE